MTTTDDRIQHFLLVFDQEQGKLIETQEFGEDSDAAVVAYASKEAQFGDQKRVEIALVGSDPLETVPLTHANYFHGSARLSQYLPAI